MKDTNGFWTTGHKVGRQEAFKESEEIIDEIDLKYRKKWEITSKSKVWWEYMLEEIKQRMKEKSK